MAKNKINYWANMNFFITSEISIDYKNELESLLFFNDEQPKFQQAIVASINQFGLPEIKQSNDKLKVVINNLDVQTLFAFNEENNKLSGVMIFYRDSIENITLIHIAVSREYTVLKTESNYCLTFMLMDKLTEIAKKIKSIKTITIYYNNKTKKLNV